MTYCKGYSSCSGRSCGRSSIASVTCWLPHSKCLASSQNVNPKTRSSALQEGVLIASKTSTRHNARKSTTKQSELLTGVAHQPKADTKPAGQQRPTTSSQPLRGVDRGTDLTSSWQNWCRQTVQHLDQGPDLQGLNSPRVSNTASRQAWQQAQTCR